MVLKGVNGYTIRKKDVYPLDPLSGLRTNQKFSSFKLKNHTETAKSTVFGQNPQIHQKPQILEENSWFLAENMCNEMSLTQQFL